MRRNNPGNISRRDFLKGSAAALVSVAAAKTLGACAPAAAATEAAGTTAGVSETTTTAAIETAVTEAAQTTAAETAAVPAGPVDGKYVTKAMGHENWIYVATTIREGKITECQVISHEETMGIGNFACSRIPAAIVEHQSINVPNIKGSSISSMAVKAAVAEAITKAGYDIADFSQEIVPKTVNVNEQEDCEVVIMGAGTAGLIAALRLLEKGRKVIVVEKNAIPGGSMAMVYGGFFCADSELIKTYDITGTEGFYDLETYMGFTKTLLKEEYDRYDGAMPYQTACYSVSGKLVDWLHSIGVGFNTMGVYEQGTAYGASAYLAPGCYKGGAGYLSMFLGQRIEKLGGIVHYSTSVDSLLKDESGQVVGVTAKGDNGAAYTIHAKKVLLSSGGFARNAELMEKYYPQYSKYWFNCCSASTGDAVAMAEELGAYMECGGRELPAFLSTYASKFELAFMHYSTPGIIVNKTGDSIGNFISDNHYSMGRAKVDEAANGDTFYYIFDDAAANSTSDFERYGFDGYKAIFAKGEAVHYDSVEECVQSLGLANLAAAIEANNAASLSGEPDAFGRKNCPFIETREGVWAIRVDPTFYLTPAGLAIDTETHVLREDGSVIENLYAAGDVAGSIEEKDGKPYGCGFIAATTYGWIAADTIDREL